MKKIAVPSPFPPPSPSHQTRNKGERAGLFRGRQLEKKKEGLSFSHARCRFRVPRLSLDGLRKKRDWLLLVYVHLGDKFLVQSIVNPQVDVSPP